MSVFYCTNASLQHTRVIYVGDTGHTHADEVAGEIFLLPLTHPEVLVLPPGPPRSSGQLLSARGPSEPSVSVTDGQEIVLFLHVYIKCTSTININK